MNFKMRYSPERDCDRCGKQLRGWYFSCEERNVYLCSEECARAVSVAAEACEKKSEEKMVAL